MVDRNYDDEYGSYTGYYGGGSSSTYVADKWEIKANGKKRPAWFPNKSDDDQDDKRQSQEDKPLTVSAISPETLRKINANLDRKNTPPPLPSAEEAGWEAALRLHDEGSSAQEEKKSEDDFIRYPARYREFLAGLKGQHEKTRLILYPKEDYSETCLALSTRNPEQVLEVRFVGKTQKYVPGSYQLSRVSLPRDSFAKGDEELYGFYFVLHETKDIFKTNKLLKVPLKSEDDVEVWNTILDWETAFQFMDENLRARSIYYRDWFKAQDIGKPPTYYFDIHSHIAMFLS